MMLTFKYTEREFIRAINQLNGESKRCSKDCV